MPAPFASAVARLNAAVHARLADAAVVFAGVAEPVYAGFTNEYQTATAGDLVFAGSAPAIELTTALVPAGATERGYALTVDGTPYKVADHRPDGAGWSVLILEAA